MAKSVMGGHNLGSIKSGRTGGRTSSGGLPTPSGGNKPAAAPLKANGGVAGSVGGPGGSGGGSKTAMPAPPPMQITPTRSVKC